MAPDLPHVIMLSQAARYGHTLPGLFLVSVPFGLAVYFLYELVLRRPMLAISPDPVRLRVPAGSSPVFQPNSRLLWIVLSVLIGATTHILWDSFTHSSGFLVPNWALLRESTPFWPYRPIYKFLQIFFSLLGLAVLAYSYWSWIRKTQICRSGVVPAISLRVRMWLLTVGVLLVCGFGLLFASRVAPASFWTLLAKFLYGAMAAGFFAILFFALWWHTRRQEFSPAEINK